MPILAVPSFGGGVVQVGSPDAQATNELTQCDGWDLGARGQLMTAPTPADYITVNDAQGTPQPLSPLFACATVRYGSNDPLLVAVGQGQDSGGATRYYFAEVAIDASVAGHPVVNQTVVVSTGIPPASPFTPPTTSFPPFIIPKRPLVTFAAFPYVNAAGTQMRPLFINLGARYSDATPRQMPGLYVLSWSGAAYVYLKIGLYDALGTGADGEFSGGTNAKQLYFRGIVAYNNFLFGWGFDNSDGTIGDGSSRLMFSNLGNPFKWGNDNLAAPGTDRAFADTDAITVGSAGEALRAGCASRGKLWLGTTKGLHYLSGYGRDSFTTDGTTGIAESLDVVGPHALAEGPDGLLYGVSSRGLWSYAGGPTNHLYRVLVAFDGRSIGYWDLLAGDGAIPGSGNLDQVWLLNDTIHQQLWVVIPYCNATSGTGTGGDTVILKYHVETGGFTRQVFVGQIFTAGSTIPQTQAKHAHVFLPSSGIPNIVDYGPGAPHPGPITFGPYAPHGPTGTGTCRVCYLTLAWTATSLPVTGTITPNVDGVDVETIGLTVDRTAPSTPADGDYWVDTSQTDTNVGNGTASDLIPAANNYLLRRWLASWGIWDIVSRTSGSHGTRLTMPISYRPVRGTRVSITVDLHSPGDLQIEGLGLEPSTIRNAA